MENSVTITFWGARGSTPCANVENMHFGGNTTCIQVKLPNTEELLIFDCGTGLRNLGNHLMAEKKALKGHIYITHPHWDHLQGFPFFKPFYDCDNEFEISIPPQGSAGCKDILQGHMSDTFFPISLDLLDATIDYDTFFREKRDFPLYSIEYMWANHTIPTAIYKLSIGEKTIIIAPDNEIPLQVVNENRKFMNDFRAFIHDADVLIHDAQFNKLQYREKKGWGHSAWEKVVEVAHEGGVKQLYLMHHDPDSTDEYLFKLSEEIQTHYYLDFNYICLIKEGQEITLPLAEISKEISQISGSQK